MNSLYHSLLNQRNDSQIERLSRFFKTGKGQYGEGDQFLGIKVPIIRATVKSCWRDTTLAEVEECLHSEYHEMRMAALLTLVQHYQHSKKNAAQQKSYVDFYLANTAYINNWDLVDLSCYEIIGHWLLDKDRQLLYNLVSHGSTLWEQRIGIVSTMQFLRHGELNDTYALADLMLSKPAPLHDLLQKATGWLLREAGKRDSDRLRRWLMSRHSTMPRTMLRYSIEKFPEEERRQWLAK